jgi:hypothetical protein
VALLKCQRAGFQVFFCCHDDLSEKHLLRTVVEFLNHPVSPWPSHWDEPWLDTVMQAKPDERPHASGMRWAAEKGDGVVSLDMIRYSHP